MTPAFIPSCHPLFGQGFESLPRRQTGLDIFPFTHTTVAVCQAYAETGIGLLEEVRDRPGFIGFELGFVCNVKGYQEGGMHQAQQGSIGKIRKLAVLTWNRR